MLALLAVLVRLPTFLATPHPLGTDGYYYVVQTEDLVARGHLHVPDTSWVFALHGLFGSLGDPVLATKLAALALVALAVPAGWLAGSAASPRAGLALATWMAASPALTHLAADFPKNLGIAAPWLLLCAAADRQGRARWGAVPAVLLLVTAHRLGAVWACVALVVWAVSSRLDRTAWAGLFVVGLVLALLGPVLPGLLGLGDTFRLQGQLGVGGLSPFAYFGLRAFHPVEQVELTLAWGGLLAGAFLLVTGRGRPSTAMATALLVVSLAPVYATDTLDLGYRLALVAPLLAAPLLVQATPLDRLPRAAGWLAPFALLLAPTGVDPDDLPPYDRYEALIAAVPRPLPELVVAHQGINFLYDHRTGREAMAWAPEPDLDPTRVGRIVWGIRGSEWVAHGAPDRVTLDADYAYVREDVWLAFRARALAGGDPDLEARITSWRNPSRVRPAALTRGRDPSRARR
ncbi:MAG: hypothetical protein H6736_05785 [Alphaproteobacteria bacterium]|nr:hypothetical protein [Alphaproteobacteria bacterium]